MKVQPGLDILLSQQLEVVAGPRIGLIASPGSVDATLTSSTERLRAVPEIKLAALFGPEHGVRGSAQAGDPVSTTIDPISGVPVYSLYGETKKPTPDMLQGVDVLIYDLQDGGVRFYTYLSTLIYVLEAGAEQGVPVLVLDRPNPITGCRLEGPMLNPAYTSFVGTAPVPMRHAMTAGELALMCNTVLNIGCDLTVIRVEGWRREMWFDQTGLPFVPPSPNLPTLDSLIVYPGTCLVEGTNLSEGRGTTRPFEYIGAPWIDGETLAHHLNALDLPGVRFRTAYFVPTLSKFQGELCAGVQLHVLNRDPFRPIETALYLLQQVLVDYPEEFAWRLPYSDGGHRPIDLLTGGSQVREHLTAGRPVSDLIASWQQDLREFDDLREPYLLYDDGQTR
jgi:uncharacterized protein YbbC (DUF1343 family)